MLILDWWELVRDFISTKPEVNLLEATKSSSPTHPAPQIDQEQPYELILNITDSDVVLVEDCSQWETNALILKVFFRNYIFCISNTNFFRVQL